MSQNSTTSPLSMKERCILLLLPAFGILLVDLASKEIVFRAAGAVIRQGRVVSAHVIKVIPGFFQLQCVMNPGAFSGWFAGWYWFLVVISIAALIAIGAYVFLGRPTGPLFLFCLGCIAGGTAGNLYDRLVYGAVRDFFRFFIRLPGGKELTWPNFNVADASICIGVGLWIFLEFYVGRKQQTGG